jgi:lysozyme
VTVTVLDVSNWNAEVDFERVRAAGIAAVYLKASEGRSFSDRSFAARRAAARAAGLHVGAYHFARPGTNPPHVEAEHFLRVVGELDARDLRPALDFEVAGGLAVARVEWARAWNRAVRGELGAWPLFYSYPALVEALAPERPIGGGLWLASFGRNDGVEHPFRVPAPWRRALLHQFSSECRVAGCSGRVDLSHGGSLAPLLARGRR